MTKRPLTAPSLAVLGLLALGAAACGGTSTPQASSTSTTMSTKTAFCAADVTIDKAGAQAMTAGDFLTVLKNNSAALNAMKQDAPSGQVGTEAKALVGSAESAVAANSASDLASIPNSYGADIDTYCGVDGSGDALPAYFGTGKGTQFCSVNEQISAGTNSAQSGSDVLTFLKAHQSLVDQFAAQVPNLPSSIKSTARSLVSSAEQAIASNNADLLSSSAVTTDAMDVGLYCGQNQ